MLVIAVGGDLHMHKHVAVDAQTALGNLVPAYDHRMVPAEGQFPEYFPGIPDLNPVDPLVPTGKGFFNLEVLYRFDSGSGFELNAAHIRPLRSWRI